MAFTEISGTKDGAFLVERVYLGIVTDRLVINSRREAPRRRHILPKSKRDWAQQAIDWLQTKPTAQVVFFHAGGSVHDADMPAELSLAPQEPMGWYFWQEDWCNYSGPYESYDQANYELGAYITWLNSPSEVRKEL